MRTRSRRQREILEYIVDFVENEGYEPSYSQIARHCGLSSKGGIARHIGELEKKGLLKRSREKGSFNLEVFPAQPLTELICEVDWLESEPGTGTQSSKEPLLVPKVLLGYLSADKVFGMVIPDNAMAGDHILEGDIALIERKSFARDGDKVAVKVDGKRIAFGSYFRKGSFIEIRPSNESYEAVRVQADKAKVLGLFRGLLRKI